MNSRTVLHIIFVAGTFSCHWVTSYGWCNSVDRLFSAQRTKRRSFSIFHAGCLQDEFTNLVTVVQQQPSRRRRHSILLLLSGVFAGCVGAPAVQALSPEQAARQYDSYAPTYDRLDGGQASTSLGIEDARRYLLSQATGNVLEIGVGTGLNLDKYNGSQISSLTLVDVSGGMLREAEERVKTLPYLKDVPVKLVVADATKELEEIFGKESFDSVVDSFSLCVMGNQGAQDCLNQMSQVAKVDGQVLLLENSRSSNRFLGLYQDVTADTAAVAGGKGCVYNQDVGSMIRKTGRLAILEETSYLAGLFRGFTCVRL